jgi:hypothetical protein
MARSIPTFPPRLVHVISQDRFECCVLVRDDVAYGIFLIFAFIVRICFAMK